MPRSNSQHAESSTFAEILKLAGEVMGDGTNMMFFGKDYEERESFGDESRRSEECDSHKAGSDSRRSRYDNDSYGTSLTEEYHKERVRLLRKRDMDNHRRHRHIDIDREMELKQKLSQFEEEILLTVRRDDVDQQSPEGTDYEYMPTRTVKVDEDVQFQGTENEYMSTTVTKTVQPINASEEPNDESSKEDEFASQMVHEMLQLLHYSRKNNHEAERLLGFKRNFIENRREMCPELDAHIIKYANHKKLEISVRRFIDCVRSGEVAETAETLSIQKGLLQLVGAMSDIQRESKELDIQYQRMHSATFAE